MRIEQIRNACRRAACRRLAAFLTTAVALLPAGAATAAPTLRLSFPIDETFPAEGLTALCGVPVWIHFEGDDHRGHRAEWLRRAARRGRRPQRP